MRVSSPAFPDAGAMPVRFANIGVAGGANDSIPLAWQGEPEATRSYVIAIVDHHPVAHGWVHWLVTDVPASVHALDQGASGRAMPASATEMLNTWGRTGYGGPQPPAGTGAHDYVTTVFAVDEERLDIGAIADWGAVREAMRGHVLAEASLTGGLGR